MHNELTIHEGSERAVGEEKQAAETGEVWKTPVSPMDDDDAHSGEESSERYQQQPQRREGIPGKLRKLSSYSRARHLSSDDTTTSSSRSSDEHVGEKEETWRVEDVEEDSLGSSSHDDSSHDNDGQHAFSGSSQSDHDSHSGARGGWRGEEEEKEEEEHHHSHDDEYESQHSYRAWPPL